MKWNKDHITELCMSLGFYKTHSEYSAAMTYVIFTNKFGERLVFHLNQSETKIDMLTHEKKGETVKKLDTEIAAYLESL